MTIDLSNSTDPEIAMATTVLVEILPVMNALAIDFLVVGATARTITSIGFFNKAPERATRDVDIAIAVASWQEVSQLQSRMNTAPSCCPTTSA